MDTTLRLEESGETSVHPAVQAVRWVSAGAPGLYTRLNSNAITVGREDGAGVKLNAAGVSRFHAEFVRQGPVYAISDRGSTNGTYVNGARVEHCALSHGDILRFGDVIGVVTRVESDVDLRELDVVEVVPGVVFGPGLRAQFEAIGRAAPTELPVVVVGQTGAGKECIARAIHVLSGRRGEFHAVNCPALPLALAEAELFGYRKGAFTGAEQSALGHVRAADGGSLFLDELADLPLGIQAKLLRVLQDHQVVALGDTRSTSVDVRFIAAIQTPLAELVSQRRLREDLAMRLNGLVVELPPLRERRTDIAVLLSYFLKLHSGGRPPALEPRLIEELMLYSWPGNVRELELTVRKLLILHGHEPKLRRSMLPNSMKLSQPALAEGHGALGGDRHDRDFSRLVSELKNNGQNLARAAETIGISRQRAYRLLRGKSVADVVSAVPDGTPQAGHDG